MELFTSWHSWPQAEAGLRELLPAQVVATVGRAVAFAASQHGDQRRPTGAPYTEALTTRRYDLGGNLQFILRKHYVVTARFAASLQDHDHRFGDVRERDQTIEAVIAVLAAAQHVQIKVELRRSRAPD